MKASRSGAVACVLVAAATMTMGRAQAADDAKYPNWKGQWEVINPRFGGQMIKFDPTKAWGPAQQAPLTPEYQKVLEESIADQASGGQGNNFDRARCMPTGMPHNMTFGPLEFVVTPDATYILIGTQVRRIFTDGRTGPAEIDPSYAGYSIGRWIDEDGDGTFDVLEAETRHFKGPRLFDSSGIPLHEDDETVVKERIYLDKLDPNLLHDEITVTDHALTRPWTVTKSYRRMPVARPAWREVICAEGNQHVKIGKEAYFLSADGYLMPTKKEQSPPDLKYFKPAQK